MTKDNPPVPSGYRIRRQRESGLYEVSRGDQLLGFTSTRSLAIELIINSRENDHAAQD